MTRMTKRTRVVASSRLWLCGALGLVASAVLACGVQNAGGDGTDEADGAAAGAGAGGAGGLAVAGSSGASGSSGVLGQAGVGGIGAAAGSAASGTGGASGSGPGGAGGMGGAPVSGTGAAGMGGAGAGTGGAGTAGSGSATAVKSSGCGMAAAPAGDTSIEVDGMSRTYLVELPPGYDPDVAYPLILGFHGAGLDAKGFRGYFDLGAVAGDEAVIAYLDALGNPTGWQYNRDIPFAEATLAQLKSQYCIDEARVFATGHSSGGYFTNALGCRLGDQLRAIAPVSGGAALRTMCTGMPAAWIAHGDDDTIVATTEGQGARDFWAEANGCDTGMSMPVEPMPCVTYAGCSPEAPVRYCEYPGSHSPPSFAVEALWAFFRGL